MTVISSYFAQIKPGRTEEAIGLCREAAKVIERLGGENLRLLRSNSGETYGSIVLSQEYENSQAWGAATDALMADDELNSLMARADGLDAPYLTQAISTASEIPLGGKAPKRGNVSAVTISRPNPGRFQDAVDLATKVARVFAKTGGSTRLLWMGAAGLQSGSLVLVTDYKNLAALGKSNDAFLADAKGQAVLEQVMGVDSPVTMLSQDIFADIPL